jgi:alpha-L-arabinofuranosidase
MTQAEYKDIKVTRRDQVLFTADLSQGTRPWRRHGGRWQVKEGVLQQTDNQPDRRAIIGDPNWTDYTLSLKARKLGGAEGFLILFRVQDDSNWIWWNLGGWGNVRHALERCDEGNKSILGQPVTGRIEAGRWYEIRIDVQGPKIRCFLDGNLIHEAAHTAIVMRSLHAVAGRVQATGEVVVKVVNVSNQPQEVQFNLNGLTDIQPKAAALVLTGNPEGENSIQQPARVVPAKCDLDKVAPAFRHTFPANSLTVLRVKAKR